jgi:2-keto-3-deoxy-L-arabinonate dehydratase
MTGTTGFHGVYPMLYSFFAGDGRLDRAAMRRQVEACLAAGVHGVTFLGIASEMNKLSSNERRQLVEWVTEDVAGRVPVAVTIPEPNVPDQIAFARAARQCGADWVILQPPPVKGVSESELVRFFGAVAQACELPVAIQNNPVNLDVWLGNPALRTLARNHPNIRLLKGEGPLLVVRRMIEETEGAFDVFGGLAGKEVVTTLAAGCVGLIPAPDCVDIHVRIYEAIRRGDTPAAEELYRGVLPLITFVNASVEHYLCYGKLLVARRIGLETSHPRGPALPPTAFGKEVLERLSAGLGPLGRP